MVRLSTQPVGRSPGTSGPDRLVEMMRDLLVTLARERDESCSSPDERAPLRDALRRALDDPGVRDAVALALLPPGRLPDGASGEDDEHEVLVGDAEPEPTFVDADTRRSMARATLTVARDLRVPGVTYEHDYDD